MFFALLFGTNRAQAQCSPDVTPPTITCAGNVTVNTTPGLCTGTATLTAPTVSDNCSLSITGNALNFDGVNDIVAVNQGSNSLTGNFTIEGWIKPSVVAVRPIFGSRSPETT